MKVVVLGGGISGTVTAYFLAKDGHDVTLIERRAGVAQETSFANGGIICPSMSEPWSAPGTPDQHAALAWSRRCAAPAAFARAAGPLALGPDVHQKLRARTLFAETPAPT